MGTEAKLAVKADLQLNGIIGVLGGFLSEQDADEYTAMFWDCHNRNFANKPFKVLVDMRGYKAATPTVQAKIAEIQRRAQKSKLIASAVITDSAMAQIQMKRIASETGVTETEDYFLNYDEAYNWLKAR